MSSDCTLRLNRRSAFSKDSPSCNRISATLNLLDFVLITDASEPQLVCPRYQDLAASQTRVTRWRGRPGRTAPECPPALRRDQKELPALQRVHAFRPYRRRCPQQPSPAFADFGALPCPVVSVAACVPSDAW